MGLTESVRQERTDRALNNGYSLSHHAAVCALRAAVPAGHDLTHFQTGWAHLAAVEDPAMLKSFTDNHLGYLLTQVGGGPDRVGPIVLTEADVQAIVDEHFTPHSFERDGTVIAFMSTSIRLVALGSYTPSPGA